MGILQQLRETANHLEALLFESSLNEANAEIRLYVDTAEVQSIILGPLNYVSPERNDVDTDKIYRSRSFALALMFNGHVRHQPYILEPHRGELIDQYHKDFGISPQIDLRQCSQRLVDGLGLRELHYLDINSAQSRDEYFTEARSWYTLLSAIDGSWRQRLAICVNQDRVKFEVDTIGEGSVSKNYAEFCEDPYFVELFEAFKSIGVRQDLSISNFTDSMAMLVLRSKVKAFREERSNVAPLFYDPNGLFRRIAEEVFPAGEFELQLKSGDKRSVFVSSEYLVFCSSIPEEIRSFDYVSLSEYVGCLVGFLNEVETGLAEDELKKKELLPTRTVSEVLSDLTEEGFLFQIWHPYYQLLSATISESGTPTPTSLIVSRILDSLSHEKDQELEEVLKNRLSELYEELGNYREVSRLWKRLETTSRQSRAKYENFDREYAARDLGLLQFSIPNDSLENIAESAFLLFQSSERSRQELVARLTTAALTLLNKPDAEIVPLAGLLWTLRIHEWIRRLTSGYKKRHYSVAILRARALISQQRSTDEALGKISDILAHLKDSRHGLMPLDGLKIDFGIAYLRYACWNIGNVSACWRMRSATHSPHILMKASDQAKDIVRSMNQVYEALVLERKSREAIDGRLVREDMFEVYVLNCLLDVIVNGVVTDELSADMSEHAINLSCYQGAPDLWQYRYSETLARYYHRMAWCAARSADEWKHYVTVADNLYESAWKQAKDEAIRNHREELASDLTLGFEQCSDRRSGMLNLLQTQVVP